MIAYLDSSVILRVVLNQPARLAELDRVLLGVTSQLAQVECLRTLDRLSVMGQLRVEHAAAAREAVYALLKEMEIVQISGAVLRRASNPMPAPLGTLDAIHLASAEVWREEQQKEPVIATHDRALALAARASGFEVIGA
jgi:predicted nucleic acid-binding protein